MLPTTGRFKNITCPYLETNCERPYCHFSHKKKSQDSPESSSSEVPTYNPTPKSQLLHTRSHIPISYVPDIVNRSDRSNSRFNSILERSQNIQPVYKPTPLSILSSTNKVSNSLVNDEKSEETPTYGENLYDNKSNEYNPEACDIDFEELSTEFDMLDEIINSSESEGESRTGKNKKSIASENKETNENQQEEDVNEKKEKSKHSRERSRIDSRNLSSKSKDKYKTDHKSDKSKQKCDKSDKKDSDKDEKKSNNKSDRKSNDKSDKKLNEKNHQKSDRKEKSDKKSSDRDSKKSNDKEDKKSNNKDSKKSSEKDERKSSDTKSEKKKSSSDKYDKEKSDRHHSHHSSNKEKHKHKSKEHEKKKKEKNDKDKSKEKKSNHDDSSKKNETKVKELKLETTKIDSEDLFDDGSNDIYEDGLDLSDDLLDDDDVDDVMQECYKIFTEYKPTEPQIEPELTKTRTVQVDEELEYVPQTKKRVAHEKAENIASRVPINKPKEGPNPALIMANRIKMARLAQAANEQKSIMAEIDRQKNMMNSSITPIGNTQKSAEHTKQQGIKRPPDKAPNGNSKQPKFNSESSFTSKSSLNLSSQKTTMASTSTSLIDDILAGRTPTTKPKRIAPAMNVSSIQRAKARLDEMAKQKAAASFNKTPSQTFGKGGKRVAHVPDYSLTDIPDVLQAEKSKLPVNVRTRYLTMMADECIKLYLSKEDAYQRALSEELKCYERCSVLATYRNSAMLAINRLRKEFQDLEKSGLGPLGSGDEPRNGKDDVNSQLKGKQFYKNIERYVLSEEELELHGYPREGPVPGQAIMKSQKAVRNVHLEKNERICCRCFKIYRVDNDGFALYEEECVYHPLKKRTLRGESIYLCCKSTDDLGCVTAPCHVCDTPIPGEYDLEGYQTTFPPEDENDPRSYAVYALDCEMCYTTKGLELTRVTIVNSECKTVYETLVKPMNPIIDYNTRFSGITKEQMDRTATTILQVQANILHLCNSKTILIGHSLESDMRALKIVHSSIIDTSVLFPHKLGLPHKRALRVLASEYLKKIIQNDVSGHDSAEDALTCMELVIWKVKEELKSRGGKS